MKKYRLLATTTYTVLLFLLFLVCGRKSAFAQVTGLSISPPTVEILLAPNKNIIQTFAVKNQGESGKFVVNLHKIAPNGTDGHVAVDPTPLDESSIPLVFSLQNADIALGVPFALGAGDSTQLVLKIEGASIDTTEDVYVALVVSSYDGQGGTSDGASAQAGVSSLILTTLTPDGVLPVNLEITNYDPPLVMDSSQTMTVHPTLANHSAVMLRTEGKLSFISPRGNHNSEIELYPNLILGNSSRELLGQTEADRPETRPLSFKPYWFTIGPYLLRLTVTTEGGTKIQEVEKTVWFLPLRALVILLILTIVILIIVLRTRGRSTIDTPVRNE